MTDYEKSFNYIKGNAERVQTIRSSLNDDIFEHLHTLYSYAKKCNSVIELGVRNCVSSYPIIMGLLDNDQNPKRMVSVDIYKSLGLTNLELQAKNVLNYEFFEGNDLDYNITENFDMVFIDTWHVRGQLERELNKYAPRCNKYIIMHDTTVDEFVGESIRNNWDIISQSAQTGFSIKEIQEGLWPAISDFLEKHPEWKIEKRYINNNGLTILRRIKCIIATPATQVIQVMKQANCSDITFCICNNDQVFIEIVKTLYFQLEDAGMICNKITDISEAKNPKTLYLIYNGHTESKQLPLNIKYVTFNYEQAGSYYMSWDHYLLKMICGVAVFDYSEYNKAYLENIINKNIFVIPYTYHPSLTVLKPDTTNTEPIDILFYGYMNHNRDSYYHLLKNSGYVVKFIANLFGNELMQEIAKAKIVLNLHYYQNPSILELSRIVPLISNFKLVLSEKSNDTIADERFKNIIEFVDHNNILDTCKKYLENPNLRYTKIANAFKLFTNETFINNHNSD